MSNPLLRSSKQINIITNQELWVESECKNHAVKVVNVDLSYLILNRGSNSEAISYAIRNFAEMYLRRIHTNYQTLVIFKIIPNKRMFVNCSPYIFQKISKKIFMPQKA